MSRTARRTAESAAIALIIATGAAGGLVAASLAAQDTDAAAVITPAAEDRFVPPAQTPSWTPPDASTQTAPQPRVQVPVVPKAPHTSRSS